ncbi:MAG: signal peptidase II [Acetobacteraceae bacterium]|nr:signal peptidase II [Acetobacteraceae bacterium]MSP29605.1 signal peptidase II [Acetobacteraceae bacterium]
MVLLILGLDQASKYWVLDILDLPTIRQVVLLPFFNLTMVWNRGVTFGLFASDGETGQLVLAGLACLAVIAFGFWLWRARSWWVSFSVGAIAGGAIGNVIDRLRFGAVVDFLHVHAWGWSWYVFNIADSAIVCGVTALIVESLFAKAEGAE